ncbi:AAA family ATPase [Leptotrichia sp. oral taxon 223]|uniref:AAA family ATPase n=1 Tax=Leptotrichia sp. oral taxon 223 TaxID=712363 RepID=UPI0015BCAAAD|nr:AAA family ATPase [Leptotrichia sp. oral taxon 223]NWO19642.1 AAA family ATPase [Leptotrichia sp. oral taxon 223]
MENKKRLPIGISDFKRIIEESYYYVDKTGLISSILKDGANVNLFTRPRRFGKTLNMSMLRYFFDFENREENKKLFDNLNISESEYASEQGKYPVIFVSFKNIEENEWEDCYFEIKNLINKLYNDFEFIRKNLNQSELMEFDKIWLKQKEADWKNSLKILTKYLYDYYGKKKVVVLIDEYDTPIIQSYQAGYYKKAISFFKRFYGEALKDNEYLQFGIMTGILRIAKEGIFSGLNNLKVNTIFSEKYSEFFGLTENEVIRAVKYYELEYELEEVKKWYDGYQFGDSEIYNPWSIINFLSAGQLRPYWIGVSGNKLIDEMLDEGNKEIFDDLGKLFNKEKIYKEINDYSEFTFDMDDIWQLFLYAGYLTIGGEKVDNEYPIRIPNNEILEFFENRFIARFIRKTQKFTNIIKDLKKGEIEEFAKGLQDEILSSLSYFDTDKDEKYYKVFLIGIFIVLGNDYIRLSERESGYGRADLVLEPKNKGNPAYIFEFKVAGNEEEMENYAKEGFEQIKEKEYDIELKNRGVKEIIHIGLGFYRKKLRMKHEKISF